MLSGPFFMPTIFCALAWSMLIRRKRRGQQGFSWLRSVVLASAAWKWFILLLRIVSDLPNNRIIWHPRPSGTFQKSRSRPKQLLKVFGSKLPFAAKWLGGGVGPITTAMQRSWMVLVRKTQGIGPQVAYGARSLFTPSIPACETRRSSGSRTGQKA